MMGACPPKTSPRAIEAAEKQKRALELRKANLTYEQIADALGMTTSAVAKSITRGLRAIPREAAEELRTLLLEQHRTMLRSIWTDVIKGNLQAIDRALRILAAIADLEGVNAPVKVNIDVIVRNAADELGLTPDEQARLHDDVEAFIAAQKAGIA